MRPHPFSLLGVSHVATSDSGPPLQNYPGYFPAKVALWKRRWFQITVASVIAFLIGIGAGGTTETATVADTPTASAPQKSEVSVSAALTKAKNEAERLRDQVSDARKHEKLAIAKIRDQARTSQQKAVRAAKAQTRAAARARQKQAVAAAVAQAEVEAPTDTALSDDSSGDTDPRFSYCYEANDAGYGSYVQGVDPEYDWYDDNDNDGTVCEF